MEMFKDTVTAVIQELRVSCPAHSSRNTHGYLQFNSWLPKQFMSRREGIGLRNPCSLDSLFASSPTTAYSLSNVVVNQKRSAWQMLPGCALLPFTVTTNPP